MNIKIIQLEQQNELIKNENSLRDVQGNINFANIHIIGDLEGKSRKGNKIIFEEMMSEIFPKLEGRYMVPGSIQSPKQDKLIQTHAKTQIIKMAKVKREYFKGTKKQSHVQEKSHRVMN